MNTLTLETNDFNDLVGAAQDQIAADYRRRDPAGFERLNQQLAGGWLRLEPVIARDEAGIADAVRDLRDELPTEFYQGRIPHLVHCATRLEREGDGRSFVVGFIAVPCDPREEASN